MSDNGQFVPPWGCMEGAMKDPGRFVLKLEEAWRTFDPALWTELYHPEATIRGPQTEGPVGRDELLRNLSRTRAALPDFRFRARRWASRGNTLFIEWTASATLAGETVEWDGVDCFELRDGRAIEEIVHFDSLPLRARVDPSLRTGPLLAAAR